MDVYIEPAPWPDRTWDPHLLVAAGLVSFTGYLLFVLVLAIVGPVETVAPTPFDDRRVPVRIETRVAPEPRTTVQDDTSEATAKPAETAPPVEVERPAVDASVAIEPEAEAETASTAYRGPLDLALPTREAMQTLPPVCRAGPCAPGTVALPRVRPARRPAHEVLADLDPEILKGLDLEALGIDPELADVYGERAVRVSRNCDLVQREDNVVSRQMTSTQYIRCRPSTESKARARALLDALREKRPDLFDDR